MLVIRLQRVGRENTPNFRITVSEKRESAKKGSHESIGHYLPALKKPIFEVKKERVSYWISKGAKPSNTLARLLKQAGMEGMEQYMVRYAKQKKKGEEAAPAAAQATAPEAAKASEKPKEEEKKE